MPREYGDRKIAAILCWRPNFYPPLRTILVASRSTFPGQKIYSTLQNHLAKTKVGVLRSCDMISARNSFSMQHNL